MYLINTYIMVSTKILSKNCVTIINVHRQISVLELFLKYNNDTENWSNDAENFSLNITGINYYFLRIKIETIIINCNSIA